MSEIRVLQPTEWDLLKQAPDGWVPDPAWVTAVVVTEGDTLVGRTAICLMPHLEGTWIAESHRNGTTGYRLIKAVEDRAKEMGLTTVLAYTLPDVDPYMERLGFQKVPLTVWKKDIE